MLYIWVCVKCIVNWTGAQKIFFFYKIHNMRLKRKHINVYIQQYIWLADLRLISWLSIFTSYGLAPEAFMMVRSCYYLTNLNHCLPLTYILKKKKKLVRANKNQLNPRQINYIKNMEIFRNINRFELINRT